MRSPRTLLVALGAALILVGALPAASHAVVAADPGHCSRVLDTCERVVAGRPEIELLSTRRRLHGDDD